MPSMHSLDNVIWTALNTRQAAIAECFGEARRFPFDVTLLGAFREENDHGYKCLASLLPPRGIVGVFLHAPYADRPGWELQIGAPLAQMVCENGAAKSKRTDSPEADVQFFDLTAADAPDMVELAKITNPGPFHIRAHELGSFIGIRKEGKLIAMAGERLKVPGYSEISGICTHPDHAGSGYARILTTEIMGRIRERGETPFLHVRADNHRAIALYEKLGFSTRMMSHYAVLRKM